MIKTTFILLSVWNTLAQPIVEGNYLTQSECNVWKSAKQMTSESQGYSVKYECVKIEIKS